MILGLIDTLLEEPEAYDEPIPPLLLDDLQIVQLSLTFQTVR